MAPLEEDSQAEKMSPLRHPSLSLSPLTNAHLEPLASGHSPAADPLRPPSCGFRFPKPPLSLKHLPSPSIWSSPFNAEMSPPRRQTGAASSQEPRRVQGLANETHGGGRGWGVCGLRQPSGAEAGMGAARSVAEQGMFLHQYNSQPSTDTLARERT